MGRGRGTEKGKRNRERGEPGREKLEGKTKIPGGREGGKERRRVGRRQIGEKARH